MRDYGTGEWDGGDPDCDHRHETAHQKQGATSQRQGRANTDEQRNENFRDACGKCGARRIDLQMGLEPTPDLFVAGMVELFREIRRVLAAHGTCWVNLGDSYASSNNGGPAQSDATTMTGGRKDYDLPARNLGGLKPKDLVGIPWRVAFALQADGWCLRSDIVWSKPNPMPESVTDRPTKAHEMVFLLTKAKWIGPERGQFAHISEEDARWLALLFDTEGNIVVKRAEREGRTQFGAQVAFANTSRHLLERAQAIVGAGSIHERKGVNAPVFYWQMGNRQARDLLYQIAPHLIVKQRQARVAIHMHDVIAEPKKRPGGYRTPEHEAFLTRCWETVKELNNFGDPDLSWVPELRYGKWKPERYWFDTEAVRERYEPSTLERNRYARDDIRTGVVGHLRDGGQKGVSKNGAPLREDIHHPGGRNVRSVWQIATQPYPEAHFATFPEELARRCILAGCPTRVCRVCGKPSERIVETVGHDKQRWAPGEDQYHTQAKGKHGATSSFTTGLVQVKDTVGWSECGCTARTSHSPDCSWFSDGGCNCGFLTPNASGVPVAGNKWRSATVLDPFIGSGTTAKVARDHQRHAIGIDLNKEYLELAARRLQQLSLLNQGG